MKNSIAIIGVSFDLPSIKNWNDLRISLSDNKTFIGEMPKNRLKEIHKVFEEAQMAKGGYLDEIDKFDNEYFGYTERESLKTFPEHRLFLTHAMKAFYHAGYSETSLKGSKTGVFYTTSKSAYSNYADVADVSFSHFDLVDGIEATKLAKYLDIRGPVIAIDTSCSSSLVAINTAKHSLNANECEMAIVGGVKTLALTKEATLNNVVHSKKGECRPFDKDADGMINGEGVVFFILKRYEQAIKDGDSILAEIKGEAINHGGDRISSLTAPSSEAQKEVIVEAWKKAKVDASKIRYIEAHGTGTILGDPIEIEGIKQAFCQSIPSHKNSSFALSSFKGQIGHLDHLSGLAGLLRLVAALNFKTIPIQANFNKLNSFFNLEDTGMYIPTYEEYWESNDNERIGGVSSFGMTGTNVHLVVSKKDIDTTKEYDEKDIGYLQISHKNKHKLKLYKDYLIEKIKDLNDVNNINRLCLKLNKIFQINKENQGIIYSSKASLIDALKSNRPNDIHDQKLFLLLDLDVISYTKERVKEIFKENLFIKKQWDEYVSLELNTIQNEDALNILFQYTIYKYLLERLGNRAKFITPKEDSLLNLLLKSKITIEQITSQTNGKESHHSVFDENLFKKYLQDNFSSKEIVIVDFSKKKKDRFNDLNIKLNTIDGSFLAIDRFLVYQKILESNINPLMVSSNPVCNDIELPYYNLKRFWPEVKKKYAPDKKNQKINLTKDEVKGEIIKIWSSVLETEDFKNDDDFFEMGGTSLSALDMIDEIEKSIEGVKILYDEIYSSATVSKLSEMVYAQLKGNSNAIKEESIDIPKLDKDQVKEIIRNIWVSILETNDFKNEDDFFEIGGTSLSALDMIDDIEKNINGAKISYDEIYSYSTISKLSHQIISQLNNHKEVVEKSVNNVKFDSKLRENKYNELIKKIKGEEFLRNVPQNILITGGTGLLGTAVIDYLINNTKSELYCIVQKKEFGTSEKRFWSIFEKHYEIENKERIHIIEGDLFLDNLGINSNDNVLNKIDLVFHIAGSPQFISQKQKEEHINFIGTKNIVDWANKREIKKLSFISTVGIVGNVINSGIENFYETDTNIGQLTEKSIHGSSKLKAEEYINSNYNYESRIFRISNIGGRYKDGHFPTDLNKNLMWLRLKSLSELKFYNDKLLDENSGVNFTPVDILSTLISEITFANVSSLKVYHIKPEKYFSNREILTPLKKTGAELEPIPYDDFITHMNKNHHKMNFHQVARKENNFKYRSNATNEIISKLKLNKTKNFDRQLYLENLISTNLKPHI